MRLLLVILLATACLAALPTFAPTPTTHVLSLPGEGLALRYGRKAAGPVRVFVPKNGASVLTSRKPRVAFRIYDDWSAVEVLGTKPDLAVEFYPPRGLPKSAQLLFLPEIRKQHKGLKAVEVQPTEFGKALGMDAETLAGVKSCQAYQSPDFLAWQFTTPQATVLMALKGKSLPAVVLALETRLTSRVDARPDQQLKDFEGDHYHW